LINAAIPDGYFNPSLSYSTLPSGKVGFSFINSSANRVRNLYIRNPVGEALELLYDSATDNIVLGMDMTKLPGVGSCYTKAESDGKYRLITDSYTKTESDAEYRLINESYKKSDVDYCCNSITSGDR
jgi:hypothetical protein